MSAARPAFVDTHVHFYDMREPDLHYAWLEQGGVEEETAVVGDYAAIRAERYWAQDLVGETRFQNVNKVVHVQAAVGIEDPVAETRWLQTFTDSIGVPAGIVAYLDLTSDDVAEQLARHAEYPALRGIRDLRYDDYLTSSDWERGLGVLERHGGLVLCDDPAIEEMALAREVARRHPDVIYCVDHAGFPKQRGAEYFAAWRAGLSAVAEADNAVVKISGLGMVDHDWTVESLRPWVLACVEAFGIERAFFGTNWPLDRLYSSYGDVLDAYAAIISEFSDDEQRALFSGNAERVFRLGGSES